MLKDWLVRRRDNPYPSRDEKKALAYETGLTYTQICNWFANWRRKLKNSGREPSRRTWGHLIKNYNTNARGNVEQFSICSSDSIWGDDERSSRHSDSPSCSENYDPPEQRSDCDILNNNSQTYNHEYYGRENSRNHEYLPNSDYYKHANMRSFDHCYTPVKNSQAQCFQISSTTEEQNSFDRSCEDGYKCQPQAFSSNKYKHQMMEKYLRDTTTSKSSSSSSPELSKWLESAAKFTPNKNNYIEWNTQRAKPDKRSPKSTESAGAFENSLHQKEELDAAEALANLACNYRQRLMNSANLPVF